jgi:maltooligosyltrehalose trehalohydrolase
LSVILDVVYNHLGPEGNYTQDFGPYFTDQYQSAWGKAVNFDGRYSCGVRNFFIENALYWFKHYHIDGLRLDAVHGIYDFSAKHFLLELNQKVDEYNAQNNKHHFLIAESDLNDIRIIQPKSVGGYGLDAQWLDDYHHSIHSLLTKETQVTILILDRLKI